jgi:glycosyltransferase involved in cell wall biosynthesis
MIVRELAATWVERFPEDEVILAVPRGSDGPFLPPKEVSVVRTRGRLHPLINLTELPIMRRRYNADYILAHNFASPSKRGAVFVQDVLFQTNPEWFSKTELAYFSLMPPLLRTTGLVLASSRSEAARILMANPGLRRPIRVCGLGIARNLLHPSDDSPVSNLHPSQFFLSVGRLNVRKNLEAAIGGLLSSRRVSQDCPIVVVGDPSGKEARPDSTVRAAMESGLVRYTGHVTDEQLAWLYRNCLLFVFLSLDEGYGLPPVEAASLGARVLVSDIPVFHETLGDRAVYVDPRSESSISSGVPLALARPAPDSPFVGPQWTQVTERIREALTGVLGQ